MNHRYLPTYLNDHLAAATGVTDLVARAASSNEGNDYGGFLAELRHEIAEDRAALERIMARLDVKRDPIKTTAARVAERIGRLKPNAHLTSYSPLSRVIELETVALGVTGKLALWRSLIEIAGAEERLDPEELRQLVERAEDQRRSIETYRIRAVQETLG
ncbi:MAG: hypothetical protein JOZ25_05555 [Actinobacteria bacterium]|nr:hypothetical protein [Actinomycetota bacterium]